MADRPTNPLWEGRAQRADKVLLGLLALSIVWGYAMIPATPSLVGSHPLLLEVLRGSMASMITMGGLARTGQASLAVAVLAGIPSFMMFDWLYWWAGRRWGARAIETLLGAPHLARKRRERLERAMERFGPVAVALAPLLPVPSPLVFAAAGLGGMRLRVFLLLDAIGSLLWACLMVGLGYGLGQRAVDVAEGVTHYALWVTLGLVGVVFGWQLLRMRRAPA